MLPPFLWNLDYHKLATFFGVKSILFSLQHYEISKSSTLLSASNNVCSYSWSISSHAPAFAPSEKSCLENVVGSPFSDFLLSAIWDSQSRLPPSCLIASNGFQAYIFLKLAFLAILSDSIGPFQSLPFWLQRHAPLRISYACSRTKFSPDPLIPFCA